MQGAIISISARYIRIIFSTMVFSTDVFLKKTGLILQRGCMSYEFFNFCARMARALSNEQREYWRLNRSNDTHQDNQPV